MPGLFMHAGATVQCTHAGPATIMPTQRRVLVNGMPVALMTDQIMVAGCVFTIPGPKPQPCVLIKWLMPSARVMINGQPAMLISAPGTGPGICQSVEQIPQGPPIVSVVQTRVIAS
jgi:uncharacterized Zn-binding protein involved in type VI secretion